MLAAAFIVCTVTLGIPLSEDTVLIWLAAVLFVVSLDDLENWRARVLRDWLPLYAVLLVYSLLRGYASHVLWGPFVRPELAVDRLIGLGAVPTVQLQQWLFDPSQLHCAGRSGRSSSATCWPWPSPSSTPASTS